MKTFHTAVVVVVLAATLSVRADVLAAQERFQVGGQVTSVSSGEFDDTDVGVGGRFSWYPIGLVGAEAEVDFYPGDFPDSIAFSSGRVEGLFGATVGPRLGRVRPFGRLRPGFVTFQEASRPIACILIFPPPLQCVLAAGRTVFALDVGGGVEWFASRRTSIRFDLGDRLVKYPGPSLDAEHGAHSDAFFGHDLRFAVGAGWGF